MSESKSKSEHTPGPWYDVPPECPPKSKSHRIITGGPCGIPHVAYVPKNAYATVEAEALANARLIAAAPDLLDACLETAQFLRMVDLIEQQMYGTRRNETSEVVRAKIRAAIAKARGQEAPHA